ncbi:MAG: dUTP diphosphatase [Eubacteriales bacterium]
MNLKVKLKLLRPGAVIPHAATASSAGCDLSYSGERDIVIDVGAIVRVPTGIAIAPDESADAPDGGAAVVGLMFGRSGLGTKFGVTLANGVGVIDADYRGEVCAPLINRGADAYTVHPGDRIAQLVFVPRFTACFEVSEELPDTLRGTGGFGSTGVEKI